MKTWKKTASKDAEPAQIQPKSQFLFHKNLPPRDFSIMTLATTFRRNENHNYLAIIQEWVQCVARGQQSLWGKLAAASGVRRGGGSLFEAASDRPQHRAPPSENCLLGPQLTEWQVLARKWRKSKIYSFSVCKKCALIWALLLIHKLYCDKIFAIAKNSCFFDTLVCSESYHYLTIKGLLCGVFGM